LDFPILFKHSCVFPGREISDYAHRQAWYSNCMTLRCGAAYAEQLIRVGKIKNHCRQICPGEI